MIARATHMAQKMAQQSSQLAARTSFLSWFGSTSAELSRTFAGSEPEESGECLKKSHELLERALENLCQIFKVCSCRSMFAVVGEGNLELKVLLRAEGSGQNCPAQSHLCLLQLNPGQVTQLTSHLDSAEDDGNSRHLPDCIQGENGLVLTQLGRKQVSAGGLPCVFVCVWLSPETCVCMCGCRSSVVCAGLTFIIKETRNFSPSGAMRMLYWSGSSTGSRLCLTKG